MSDDENMCSSNEDERGDEYGDNSQMMNEECEMKCLKCTNTLGDIRQLALHMKEAHNFDLSLITREAEISSEYDWIKFVNFARSNPELSAERCITDQNVWKTGEDWSKPVMENDELLFLMFEDLPREKCNQKVDNEMEFEKLSSLEDKTSKKTREMLEFENKELKRMVAMMRATMCRIVGSDDDLPKDFYNSLQNAKSDDDATTAGVSKLSIAANNATNNANKTSVGDDISYFSGYGHHAIHWSMLKDSVRTRAYENFIKKGGARHFRGRTVMDVGCGTAVLSMFAVQAGATKVYALEPSDMYFDACEIVRKNKMEDRIELIHSTLEDLNRPELRVDTIISEWMGYALLYEAMLPSVLLAARRHLRGEGEEREKAAAEDPAGGGEGGGVFPCVYAMRIQAAAAPELHKSHLTFWNDAYGLDMSCIARRALLEPLIHGCAPPTTFSKSSSSAVPLQPSLSQSEAKDGVEFLSDSRSFLRLNLASLIRSSDAANVSKNIQNVLAGGTTITLPVVKSGTIDSLVIWFDTWFENNGDVINGEDGEVSPPDLSTGPLSPSTHWQQTVLLLKEPLRVSAGNSVTLRIAIKSSSTNPRGLEISVKLNDQTTTQHFKMD